MLIEVVYALPERQTLVELEMRDGSTARQAALASGLAEQFPELDVEVIPLGVFGVAVDDDRVLEPGDRVELYRPLAMDPREARRVRARNE